MSLWLNKSEKEYLLALMKDDMVEFPDGWEDGNFTEEKRSKLFEKLNSMKA